jgi:hypothetical protein
VDSDEEVNTLAALDWFLRLPAAETLPDETADEIRADPRDASLLPLLPTVIDDEARG